MRGRASPRVDREVARVAEDNEVDARDLARRSGHARDLAGGERRLQAELEEPGARGIDDEAELVVAAGAAKREADVPEVLLPRVGTGEGGARVEVVDGDVGFPDMSRARLDRQLAGEGTGQAGALPGLADEQGELVGVTLGDDRERRQSWQEEEEDKRASEQVTHWAPPRSRAGRTRGRLPEIRRNLRTKYG
jgi:hypothetical protein